MSFPIPASSVSEFDPCYRPRQYDLICRSLCVYLWGVRAALQSTEQYASAYSEGARTRVRILIKSSQL